MAVATYVVGSSNCFRVNRNRFADLTESCDCTLESRFSGKLDSLDEVTERGPGPSTGLTAPDDDPPLLAARKPLLVDIELDCLE